MFDLADRRVWAVIVYAPLIVSAAGGCCGASALAVMLHTMMAWW